MSTKTVVKKKLAALNLNGLTPPQVVAHSNHYVACMTGNVHFPNPSPDLASITAQALTVQKDYDTSLTRVRGSVGIMHAELKKLTTSLKLLAVYVETIANADPANAENIIDQAGMDVKKPSVQKPKSFSAVLGKTSGTVVLNTKAAVRGVYIYQMSTDPTNAALWTVIATDNKVKYTKTGLTSGTRYYFRVAVVQNSVEGNWSPVLNVMIP